MTPENKPYLNWTHARISERVNLAVARLREFKVVLLMRDRSGELPWRGVWTGSGGLLAGGQSRVPLRCQTGGRIKCCASSPAGRRLLSHPRAQGRAVSLDVEQVCGKPSGAFPTDARLCRLHASPAEARTRLRPPMCTKPVNASLPRLDATRRKSGASLLKSDLLERSCDAKSPSMVLRCAVQSWVV